MVRCGITCNPTSGMADFSAGQGFPYNSLALVGVRMFRFIVAGLLLAGGFGSGQEVKEVPKPHLLRHCLRTSFPMLWQTLPISFAKVSSMLPFKSISRSWLRSQLVRSLCQPDSHLLETEKCPAGE